MKDIMRRDPDESWAQYIGSLCQWKSFSMSPIHQFKGISKQIICACLAIPLLRDQIHNRSAKIGEADRAGYFLTLVKLSI